MFGNLKTWRRNSRIPLFFAMLYKKWKMLHYKILLCQNKSVEFFYATLEEMKQHENSYNKLHAMGGKKWSKFALLCVNGKSLERLSSIFKIVGWLKDEEESLRAVGGKKEWLRMWRRRCVVPLRRISLISLYFLLLSALRRHRIRLVQCTRIILHSLMYHGVCVYSNLLCGQSSCEKGNTKATEKATKWTGKEEGKRHGCGCQVSFLNLTLTRTYYILHTLLCPMEIEVISLSPRISKTFPAACPRDVSQSVNFWFSCSTSKQINSSTSFGFLRRNLVNWWMKNYLPEDFPAWSLFSHLNCVSWVSSFAIRPSAKRRVNIF